MELKDCEKGLRVRVAKPPAGRPHLAGWVGRIVKKPDKPTDGVWAVEVKFLNGSAMIGPDCLEACE